MRLPPFSRAVPALLVALALSAGSAGAAVHTVPGQYARIGTAITAAFPGDTVLVAAGTYSAAANGEVFPILLSKAVHVLGAGRDVTVLDAADVTTVVDIAAGPGGHLSGFTLTGGWAPEGAGIRILAGTPEIDHCLLIGNSAYRYGSGIYVTGSAAPWIHHNVIWESGDQVTNDALDPHGIDLRGGNGLVEHNLVGRGVSNGIFIQAGSAPTVRNNILFENGTPGVRGRGICAFGDSGTVVAHNLFHGNAIAALVVPAAPFVDVTAAEANDLDPADGIYGNLDGDPLFANADLHDWSLTALSPAIDAGHPSSPPDPDGTAADIGPLYFDQSTSGAPVAGPDAVRAFPNPFRGSVRFLLAPGIRAPIVVLDARGRVVRRLPAGAVSWDGRDDAGAQLPSGVYFVLPRGRADRAIRIVRLR